MSLRTEFYTAMNRNSEMWGKANFDVNMDLIFLQTKYKTNLYNKNLFHF